MKTCDGIEEFNSKDALSAFLTRNNREQEYIIQKIFRSPDKVYFVWYTWEVNIK